MMLMNQTMQALILSFLVYLLALCLQAPPHPQQT
jgi:hypothetical protein